MTLCDTCLSDIPSVLLTSAIVLVVLAIIVTLFNQFKTNRFKKNLKIIKKQPNFLHKITDELEVRDNIVLFSHSEPLAFCLGIFNPKIFLSTKLLSVLNKNELKAVILHEQQHFLSKDNLSLMILNLIKYMFFFFPVTNDLVKSFELHREVKADQNVINNMESKKFLISALQKVISNVQLNLLLATSFSKETIFELRIKKLMGENPKLSILHFKNIIISFCMFLLMFAFVINKIEVHAQSSNSTLLCLDKGTCQNSCQ